MGIRTVMITGDNPLTAAAIAEEAGVDDFLAEATPEEKMELIRERAGAGQAGGHDRRRHQRRAGPGAGRRRRGDEHRHAGGQRGRQHGRPRLQPDQAASRSWQIGKQLLMTRGALTTFSHRQRRGQVLRHHPGDVHGRPIPQLEALERHAAALRRTAPILSAVIFNALIIVALIPLALRGVKYRPIGAAALLRRNLLIYGARRHRSRRSSASRSST